MATLSLTQRIVRVHRSLMKAELPHAFGGALALAFCTRDPRATHDIDLNVFVGVGRVDEVIAALPKGITCGPADRRLLARDGQRRLWWGDTPVDVFLSTHPFHDEAQRRCRTVPFAGVEAMPVLACSDLAVFKAFFARPKDAVDIATMIEAGTLDPAELLATVTRMLGADSANAAFVARCDRHGRSALTGQARCALRSLTISNTYIPRARR